MSKTITCKDLFNGVILPLEIVMEGNYSNDAKASFSKIKSAVTPLLPEGSVQRYEETGVEIFDNQLYGEQPIDTAQLIKNIEEQGYKNNSFPFSYLKSYCSQVFNEENIRTKTEAPAHLDHIAETIREFENQQSSGASVRTLTAS